MSDNINPYSLYEVIIAGTNSDATAYEDPVALYKDQMFTVTDVVDDDEQRDSGKITSSLSISVRGDITLQSGGIPFEAYIVMTGASSSTSGAEVTVDPPAGENKPYWGAIGIAPTEDGRYLAMGTYKNQLAEDPEVNFDGTTNQWITSEMSGKALVKESVGQYKRFKIYDTLADWTAAKPTDGTEFLAWFA